MSIDALLTPRSVAIVGASENVDKIGGRPIQYMRTHGFAGEIWPVNPSRDTIQGLQAFPSLDALPYAPDVAVIAVAGEAAVKSVECCARIGVAAAVIIASGFGETGPEGKREEERLRDVARAAGMRLVGPNSQGLANFGSGAVLSFSTMFAEEQPEDGPVAIVSQSGAMSGMTYGMLRSRGIGVRHVHATGNDCDVTVAELAGAVVVDPDVKLLLLYLEHLTDADMLANAAALGRKNGVPIIVLKSGRSIRGQLAAASHTGAIATPDRTVDAFLGKHGIWRAENVSDLVRATELYLREWRAEQGGLTIISTSGASGVLATDAAEELGLTLADLSKETECKLKETLPAFAGIGNPIDLTGAILSDSSLLPRVVKIASEDPATNAILIGLPVSGRGYDVDGMAHGAADVARQTGKPVVLAAAQQRIRFSFAAKGIPVFETDHVAVGALAQVKKHRELMQSAVPAEPLAYRATSPQSSNMLDELASLNIAEEYGVPVVERRHCQTIAEAQAFLSECRGAVVLKAVSGEIPHKSEHALVHVELADAEAVNMAFVALRSRMQQIGCPFEGVVVSPMLRGTCEIMVGGHLDPVFGPVVVIGDGGVAVEAIPDNVLLLPPFSNDDVRRALAKLRIAPFFEGFRGRPPLNEAPVLAAAQAVSRMLLRKDAGITSVDLNPIILSEDSGCAVDASIEVDSSTIDTAQSVVAR